MTKNDIDNLKITVIPAKKQCPLIKDIIQELRNRTGLGLKKCKESLEKCNWDVDKAFTYIKDNENSGINILVTRR
jgi:hypothetical protein